MTIADLDRPIDLWPTALSILALAGLPPYDEPAQDDDERLADDDEEVDDPAAPAFEAIKRVGEVIPFRRR